MKTIPATEAKNRFGKVLRELTQTGEPILINKDGKPIAVIVEVEAYERLQKKPILSKDKSLALEAFGMWQDRDDIDEAWLEEGRSQWNSEWRDEDDV